MHNADRRPPVATRSFHKWILCAPCASRPASNSQFNKGIAPSSRILPEIRLSLVYGRKKLDRKLTIPRIRCAPAHIRV